MSIHTSKLQRSNTIEYTRFNHMYIHCSHLFFFFKFTNFLLNIEKVSRTNNETYVLFQISQYLLAMIVEAWLLLWIFTIVNYI
jgi:hypothetical protein